MHSKHLSLIDAIFPYIENKTLSLIRDVGLVFSFAILTGISAKLSVEIGLVPITIQTFVVLLSGALLGSKRGVLSQLTYLSMGISGLPWFARGGGIGYITQPTFGYIIGFVLAAYVVGRLIEKGWDRNIATAIFAMIIGSAAIYVPGILWLAPFVGLGKVLAFGLYPFLLGDALKILAAGIILPLGWKIIKTKV